MNAHYTYLKRISSDKRLLVMIVYIAALALLTAVLYVDSMMSPVNTLSSNGEKLVNIPKGASADKVASILKTEGLIKSEKFFKVYAGLKGFTPKIKAGVYRFKPDLPLDVILKDLVTGNTVSTTVRFTIPEGLELGEIASKLAEAGIVDRQRFIEVSKAKNFDYWFLKDLHPDTSLEGYLFPDTYEVYRGEDEINIINRMLERFEQKFRPEYNQVIQERRTSVHEIVTMASIIEREAKVARERPLISSVFYNRLERGWLLQSCVTVQYALGERKKSLLYDDLEIESPYNTYKHPGLPPGPVSNPGESSLKAALYPAKTEFLFFVANGDGTHEFSRTYSEHLKAISRNR